MQPKCINISVPTCLKSPEIVKKCMKTIRDDSLKKRATYCQRTDIHMSFSSSANVTHFEDADEIDLTTQFAKAIFVSGTPLSIVEHPLWIQLFEKLQPNFKMPSRKALSTKYLEKVYKEMRLELDEELNACNYLHLQCDGWLIYNLGQQLSYIMLWPNWFVIKLKKTFGPDNLYGVQCAAWTPLCGGKESVVRLS